MEGWATGWFLHRRTDEWDEALRRMKLASDTVEAEGHFSSFIEGLASRKKTGTLADAGFWAF